MGVFVVGMLGGRSRKEDKSTGQLIDTQSIGGTALLGHSELPPPLFLAPTLW